MSSTPSTFIPTYPRTRAIAWSIAFGIYIDISIDIGASCLYINIYSGYNSITRSR